MARGSGEISSLTGLRGFAATAVAISHFSPLPAEVFVDLFFALSGFVISLVYLPQPGGRVAWRSYAAARFARIYPLHLLTAAAAGVLISLGVAWHEPVSGFPAQEVLRELTMTMPFFSNIAVTPWNGPAWSIAVEWWAYFLLFPVLVRFGSRIPRDLAAVLVAAAAVALGVALGRVDLTVTLQNGFALARAFIGFAGGWVAYRYYVDRPGRTPGYLVDGLCLGIAAAAFVWPLALKQSVYFCLPLFPLMIYGLAQGGSVTARLMSSRPLVYLGAISYSIYLLHFLIYLVMAHLEQQGGVRMAWPARLALGMAATLALAPLAYRFWELPMRDRARSLLRGRRRKRGVAVAGAD